jgi:hypothetical protein
MESEEVVHDRENDKALGLDKSLHLDMLENAKRCGDQFGCTSEEVYLPGQDC